MADELARIERIHTRLLVRYAGKWLSMWDGLDMKVVRQDWHNVLGEVTRYAIDYALANLPTDWPPNAAQFREICLRAPSSTPALPAPAARPDPERVAAILAGLKNREAAKSPRAWAHELKARHKAGEPLTPGQVAAYQQALREAEHFDTGMNGRFTPIDDSKLPPAMRRQPSIHHEGDPF